MDHFRRGGPQQDLRPDTCGNAVCGVRNTRPAKWRAKQLELLLAAKVEREITPEERARAAERVRQIVASGVDPGADVRRA